MSNAPASALVPLTGGSSVDTEESGPVSAVRRRSRRTFARAAGVFLAAVTLWGTFRGVNLRALASLLGHARGAVVLAFVPSLFAVVLECKSWQMAFELLGRRLSLGTLLRVRVASESLGSMLPLGAVFCETLKPPLFSRYAGLQTSTSVAAIVARKYLLMSAHGVYITLGFVLGFGALTAGFERVTGAAWLSVTVLLTGFSITSSAQVAMLGFRGGRVFEVIVATFARIPWQRLRDALGKMASGARRSDRETSAFFSAHPRQLLRAIVPCVFSWLFEAVETWVILRLFGVQLGFHQVIGVEVLVGLGRQLFVFLPGGLGAQELGYATFLSALGVNLETSAAFAVVKRSRELVWICVGLAMLVERPRHTPATALTS